MILNRAEEEFIDETVSDLSVPVFQYQTLSTNVFISALRVTGCDIMCTTNTYKAYTIQPIKKVPKSSIAKLPYKPVDVLPSFSSGATDMQQLINAESKDKRNERFKEERIQYFTELQSNRNENKAIEQMSIIKIQARYRGYRRRRGILSEDYLKQRRTILLIDQLDIREELAAFAGIIGLKPIHGLSVESTKKKSLRQKRLETHAAVKLTYFFRIAIAKVKLQRKREFAAMQKRENAASTIQKFFKYIVFQTKLEKVVSALKRNGAVRIQRCCRGFLARFRVRRMRVQKREAAKRLEAKVKLQRAFRKKYSSNSLALVDEAPVLSPPPEADTTV
jgi:hypothetical protein